MRLNKNFFFQSGTVREDFQGFIAVVGNQASYPLTLQNSIRIKPGHETIVKLGATKVIADADIKSRTRHFALHIKYVRR